VLKKYYDVEVNKYNKIESKKIIQLDLNMNLIRIWNDSSQIKNIHKEFNIKNINSCLNNRTKTAYNSIWIKKSNYIKDNIDKIKADIENVPNGYKIVQMDLDNNLIKTWNSIAQVKEYGFDTHSVRNCCEGTQPNHKEYKWLYFEDYNNSNFNIFKGYKYNKIIQLSLNGEYIKTWEGTTSICNALGIDSCAINQCCVGKSSSSNGFQWVREKDYINNNFIFYKDRKNKKYKNIIQLTIEGDFIKEWIGAQDVYINLGIKGITACCKGKVKSCGGFKWMYKEDYEKLLNKNIEN
jgi:hypothetical protein